MVQQKGHRSRVGHEWNPLAGALLLPTESAIWSVEASWLFTVVSLQSLSPFIVQSRRIHTVGFVKG